ncbi:MAG: phage holin family protein [Bowdeniella nasicola]|nr:phage holin family protein [Bowdeniella nasicola]
MKFLQRCLVNGVAIWLATLIIPGLTLAPRQSIGEKILVLAVVAVVFTLVNTLVRPLAVLLSIPLYLLTLGLFALVINALMLLLTGWISSHTSYFLQVDGFWPALFGGIIIAIAGAILNPFLQPDKK